MKNLLPSGLEMHHKFDLKGSTYKRKASRKERNKSHPTFKDLDFMEMYPEGILLQPELYNSLFDTIERDCRALESLKIMDYSFLMGIHNLDQSGTKKPLLYQMQQKFFGETEPGGGSDTGSSEDGEGGCRPPMLERVGSFQQKERLIAHSTALESITAEVDVEVGVSDELDIMEMCNTWGGIPAKNHKGENLLIFIGIIDVLQSYGITKKLEHTWKSIIHDGDTVSVHRPAFYAMRFKKFLSERVFKKLPPNLKPALSFRRPVAPPKRLISKDSGATAGAGPSSGAGVVSDPGQHLDKVERLSVDNSVTVITIGADVAETSASILPSVLRDKPRASTTVPPAQTRVPPTANRPDVADVEVMFLIQHFCIFYLYYLKGVACTPPPDFGGQLGGITTDDERIQIYVPSPQSTPYSTISRHVTESHKNITFVNYKPDTPDVETTASVSPLVSSGAASAEAGAVVSVQHEDNTSLVHIYSKSAEENHNSIQVCIL